MDGCGRKSTRIITVRPLSVSTPPSLSYDSTPRSLLTLLGIKPPDHFCCSRARHCRRFFTIGEKHRGIAHGQTRRVIFCATFRTMLTPLERVSSPLSRLFSHQTTPLKRNKYLTRHLRLCTRVIPSCDPFIEIVRLLTFSRGRFFFLSFSSRILLEFLSYRKRCVIFFLLNIYTCIYCFKRF